MRTVFVKVFLKAADSTRFLFADPRRRKMLVHTYCFTWLLSGPILFLITKPLTAGLSYLMFGSFVLMLYALEHRYTQRERQQQLDFHVILEPIPGSDEPEPPEDPGPPPQMRPHPIDPNNILYS